MFLGNNSFGFMTAVKLWSTKRSGLSEIITSGPGRVASDVMTAVPVLDQREIATAESHITGNDVAALIRAMGSN